MKNAAENPSRLTSGANDPAVQLALQTAISGAVQVNAGYQAVGAAVTANIPNPTSANGVVVAAVLITPKLPGGKIRIQGSVISNVNGNVGTQQFRARIAQSGAAPTIGTTTLAPFAGSSNEPDVSTATACSAVCPIDELMTGVVGATWICLVVSQSVASAFAVAAGAGGLFVSEVP